MNRYSRLRALLGESKSVDMDSAEGRDERNIAAGQGRAITSSAKKAVQWWLAKGYVKVDGKWIKSKEPGRRQP